MPEPISIISAAALALHTARRTKDFVDSITGAPKAMSNVSIELTALQVPLANLNNLLIQNRLSGSVLKNDLSPQLDRPLANCQETFENIETAIKPYVKFSSDGKIGKWRSLKWGFKEKNVEDLTRELSRRKETLDIAISCANLILSQHSNDDVRRLNKKVSGIQMHFGIDSYSVADSDFAGSDGPMFHSRSRVTNWISETETVIEEPVRPPDSDSTTPDDHQSEENDLPGSFPTDLRSTTIPSSVSGPILMPNRWASRPSPSPTTNPGRRESAIHAVRPIRQQAPKAAPKTSISVSDRLSRLWITSNSTESPGPSKRYNPGPAKRYNQGPPKRYNPGHLKQSKNNLTKPLRKTIVSRAALRTLHIDFEEDELGKTVLVDEDLLPRAIAEARKLSLELSGSNRQNWWTKEYQAQTQPDLHQIASVPKTRESAPSKSASNGKLLSVRATQVLHRRTKTGNINPMWRYDALELDRNDIIVVEADVWFAASKLAWIPGKTEDGDSGVFPKHFAKLET